jgi:2-oxoglutarate-Fe(II)-dependent oxygenase superfamily protein
MDIPTVHWNLSWYRSTQRTYRINSLIDLILRNALCWANPTAIAGQRFNSTTEQFVTESRCSHGLVRPSTSLCGESYMLSAQELLAKIGNLAGNIANGRPVQLDRIGALEPSATHWAEVSKDPSYLVKLAWISRESQDLPNAMRLLQAADKACPNDPGVRIGFSHVFEKMGDLSKAQDILRPIFNDSGIQSETLERARTRALQLERKIGPAPTRSPQYSDAAYLDSDLPVALAEETGRLSYDAQADGQDILSQSMVDMVGFYADAFKSAHPFKHVVVENFFEPSFAENLLAEFPAFDPKLAMNEMGRLGGKAVNTRIRSIGPAYHQLHDALGTRHFLDVISRVSGIPDLIMDPTMFGGGTHDNHHGQELDVHVDFNLDESEQLHRRLNVIVYLNKEWKSEWGGALEIHSHPWNPDRNQIHSIAPLFNRCVIFETNERSWHGFPKIDLPPEKRHLSRKSISIYLYTKDRPAKEIVPKHGTFYVQRPLPSHIREGRLLTAEDVMQVKSLLRRRDDWLMAYQKMELDKNREIAIRDAMIKDLKASSWKALAKSIRNLLLRR